MVLFSFIFGSEFQEKEDRATFPFLITNMNYVDIKSTQSVQYLLILATLALPLTELRFRGVKFPPRSKLESETRSGQGQTHVLTLSRLLTG